MFRGNRDFGSGCPASRAHTATDQISPAVGRRVGIVPRKTLVGTARPCQHARCHLQGSGPALRRDFGLTLRSGRRNNSRRRGQRPNPNLSEAEKDAMEATASRYLNDEWTLWAPQVESRGCLLVATDATPTRLGYVLFNSQGRIVLSDSCEREDTQVANEAHALAWGVNEVRRHRNYSGLVLGQWMQTPSALRPTRGTRSRDLCVQPSDMP